MSWLILHGWWLCGVMVPLLDNIFQSGADTQLALLPSPKLSHLLKRTSDTFSIRNRVWCVKILLWHLALMYYLTNCLFFYHFLSKPMEWCIIITDRVSIETWIISPVAVNYQILSLSLPLMVAFFPWFMLFWNLWHFIIPHIPFFLTALICMCTHVYLCGMIFIRVCFSMMKVVT